MLGRGTATQRSISSAIWRYGWAHRIQLTSDGHKPYLEAVEQSFGADIDYAMLIKHYGETAGPAGTV